MLKKIAKIRKNICTGSPPFSIFSFGVAKEKKPRPLGDQREEMSFGGPKNRIFYFSFDPRKEVFSLWSPKDIFPFGPPKDFFPLGYQKISEGVGVQIFF